VIKNSPHPSSCSAVRGDLFSDILDFTRCSDSAACEFTSQDMEGDVLLDRYTAQFRGQEFVSWWKNPANHITDLVKWTVDGLLFEVIEMSTSFVRDPFTVPAICANVQPNVNSSVHMLPPMKVRKRHRSHGPHLVWTQYGFEDPKAHRHNRHTDMVAEEVPVPQWRGANPYPEYKQDLKFARAMEKDSGVRPTPV
jgi:hypothetical protein